MTSEATPVRLGRVAPGIPVTNIERSVEFYRSLFGLEKTFENGEPVGFVILAAGDAEVHLTLVRGHVGGTHNVMHVMVDDAAALYQRCEATGARVIKRLRDAPWGLRTFVVADPDGNRIDVGQPLR